MEKSCTDETGTWEFYKDSNDEWRRRCTAANGRIVLASNEGYKNNSDCIANANLPGMTCNLS